MAQQQPQDRPRNEIGFQEIELLKKETLGVGSYGSVCKARCDHLLCVAKIIHLTLVSPNALQQISHEREHRLPIKRFEMECDFLREIRNPNIIQYLGMCQDPETGLPVLLMELMDESLTHFLENSDETILYQIQLSFCLDISQALSFLHMNGIIHRDLSSNNVLLIGKGRAKLTDFGMAKLTNVRKSRVSNTVCPGTDAYMPPEAIDNQAIYTEKGDVFSFGVNIIQILTRKFPKPGDRFNTVTSSDPQFPSGRIRVCVSEIECRNNHISDINPTHPLLTIARDCLKDQEGERPSAGELCQRLAALKVTPEYTENERALGHTTQQTTLAERDHQITEQQQQLQSQQEHDEQIQQSQRTLIATQQDITARQQEIQDLREELSTAQATVREKEQIIMTKDKQHREDEEMREKLSTAVRERAEKECRITELCQQLLSQQQEHEQVTTARQQEIQDLREELSTAQATVREKEQIIMTRDQQQREHKYEVVAEFEGLELNSRVQSHSHCLSSSNIDGATPPPLPPRGIARATSSPQPSAGHQPAQHPPSTSNVGVIRLNWTQHTKAPCKMVRSTAAAVDGYTAYFDATRTHVRLYAYISNTNT